MKYTTLIDGIKKTLRIAAFAITVGFSAGIVVSFRAISSNQYLQHRMFRLAAVTAAENINQWIVLLILIFLGISVCWYITKTIGQLFINKAGFQTRSKKGEFLVSFLAVALFTCYVLWDLYCYGFSPQPYTKRFLFDAIVFSAAVLITGRLISGSRWYQNNSGKTKYWGVPATVMVIVLATNIYTVFDFKHNTPTGPNVILIVVDTLRADHVGCYGYTRNTTPRIDGFANDSIVFKNAVSAAPWTSPSIGSLITSQYPVVLGMTESAGTIDDKFLLLSEILRENNYKTHGIISHVFISRRCGFAQGYDTYDEDNDRGEDYYVSSPSITQKAIDFVEQNRNNKFFLFLHYFDPHYAYILHKKYNFYPDYNGPISSGMSLDNLLLRAPYMSLDDINYVISLYDSEIAFTDEYIGKFLDKLKSLGLYDDTVIIITGDHGEEFSERGDHYIGHMRKIFQEMIHVPLMIKLPGIIKKKTVDDAMSLIDVMPSIANLLKLKIPDNYQYAGKAINLEAPDTKQNKMIFCETRWTLNFQAVISQEWKLIQCPEMKIEMLFNLREDPGERENLIANNKKKARELGDVLKGWNQEMARESSRKVKRKTVFSEEDKTKLKALGYLQ